MSNADSLEYLNQNFGMTEDPTKVTESDYIDTKAYLLKNSSKSGMNVYNYLSAVISKILKQRPENIVATFEEIAYLEKKLRFSGQRDLLKDKPSKLKGDLTAIVQKKLFKKNEDPTAAFNGFSLDPDAVQIPNLLQAAYYYEQAGIGLGHEEMIKISLALKILSETEQIKSVRFWGKIFGLQRNYYIAEVDFQDGVFENEIPAEYEIRPVSRCDTEDILTDEKPVEEELPKPNPKPPVIIPPENSKSGANKKSYFVCNILGESWIQLPLVTPKQITVARLIKKFFTGILDNKVASYPPFPGLERHLLTAQIARISAATHISPAGFYQLDEEQEIDEEEGEVRENYIKADEFEGLSVEELADEGLENWVHHGLFLLDKQSRVRWWDAKKEQEQQQQDQQVEEEEQDQEEIEPEEGLPLLTPLSEDAPVSEEIPSWTATTSSKLLPEFALAILRSNHWPGAYAIANKTMFEYIYIGWGIKNHYKNFTPAPPFTLQKEFMSNENVTEIEDPSAEEDLAALEAANKAEESQGSEPIDDDQDDDQNDDQDDED